ncbi:hypothetical protein EJ08DRAFT_721364 [Tothia fuscella]|uniref:Uncharacterized protein n=1 Tax=Tothia fuscella TaxID=1048955 RepID=A0A9P4NME6_9PEZI|nr:hypothetical protein EJ08DRAFT_721364 [Tothia fuscella]
MSGELAPPRKSVELEDPGAHELDSSDDNFTDASEGQKAPSRSGDHSPIPLTRVERVDDEPSYGEVPGTSAYKLREQDAVPDEIEVVPDGARSRSASRVNPHDLEDRPITPTTDVPKIVAEKVEPEKPAYGDVPGTAAYELRKADARPDEVIRSPAAGEAPPNPWSARFERCNDKPASERLTGRKGSSTSEKNILHEGDEDGESSSEDEDEEGEDEGFGDDFDDFEEGQAGDDDFGEFDDGGTDASVPDVKSPGLPLFAPQPSIPVLDLSELDSLSDIQSACEPYLHSLFPSYPPISTTSSDLPSPSPRIFLSDRSLSLYTQLIAPPPLAPPNWLRSRIRRLFLVSLGVPVDLDEILPASKQKKLILPSIHLKPHSDTSPRESTDSRSNPSGAPTKDALGKLKSAHDSTTSVTSSASTSKRRPKRSGAKEAPTQPDFDVGEAMRLAQTTEVRLEGMSDEELKGHCKELELLAERAGLVLAFWEERVKEAGREKEAFEGVIENLVSFARKVRK